MTQFGLAQRILLEKKLYRELLQKTRSEQKEILRRHSDCISRTRMHISDVSYLLNYFGIAFDEKDATASFANCQPIVDAREAASRIITNVCPPKRRNFRLEAGQDAVDVYYRIYSSVPEELIEVFGEDYFPTVSREETEVKLNSLLIVFADLLSDVRDDSEFQTHLLDNVLCMMISNWVSFLMPTKDGNGIICKKVDPRTVAVDYDDEQRPIGVYRELLIRKRDLRITYPDLIDEPYAGGTTDDVEFKLRECCFKVNTKFGERWVYAVFDDHEKLIVFNVKIYRPFLIVTETLPLHSNVGVGRLRMLKKVIENAERDKKSSNNVRDFNSDQPFEVVKDYLDEKYKQKGARLTIEKGKVYEVHKPGAFARFGGIDETPLLAGVQEQNAFLNRSMLGAPFTPDTRATATFTNAELEKQAQFIMSTSLRIARPLLFQLAQIPFLILKSTGALHRKLRVLFSTPRIELPYWLSFLFEKAQERDSDKIFQIAEQYLDNFIDECIEAAGGLEVFNFRVTSPIGMKQDLEDAQQVVGCLTTVSQLLNLPLQEFVSSDRLARYLVEKFGVDGSLLLTDKEREAREKARAEAMQQQQMMQLQAEAIKKS